MLASSPARSLNHIRSRMGIPRFNLFGKCSNWLEIIKTLAPVATAVIALIALKNWQHQDKAKREAEFLDALIDATHTYIAEMPKPITILEMAKIGMESHKPTWESGEPADIAVKGAIAYIQKNGEREAKRLLEALEAVQPSVIKLRAFSEKIESGDSHTGANMIQASHWRGG